MLIGAAGVILAAAAGAGLAMVTGSDNKTGTTASTASTSTSSRTATSKTGTSTATRTQTTATSASNREKAYIADLDDLVAQNAQLEPQISAAADQINRVAPNGITDAMLSEIDRLGMKFLAINSDAQRLDVPPGFIQTQRDFLQLTDYNMTRCDSLYAGATYWQAGQPYTAAFAEGQTAKEAYQALYPRFTDEFAAAKAPLH